MRRAVFAFTLVSLLLVSCSCSWLQKRGTDGVVTTIYEVAKSVSTAGEDAFRLICGQVAKNCFDNKDEQCVALVACQSNRDVFTAKMTAVNGLLALAQSQRVSGAIDKAKEFESQARSILKSAEDIVKDLIGVK